MIYTRRKTELQTCEKLLQSSRLSSADTAEEGRNDTVMEDGRDGSSPKSVYFPTGEKYDLK